MILIVFHVKKTTLCQEDNNKAESIFTKNAPNCGNI